MVQDLAIPVEGKALQDAEQQVANERDLLERSREELRGVQLEAIEGGYRGFVAPLEQNTSILVKAGTIVQIRDPSSPTGFRDASRQGDIFATFVNGVLVTNVPEVIAWCESHDALCRDVNDPQTDVWYEMKLAQIPLSTRDPSMAPSINIDRALRGDFQQFNQGGEAGAVQSARAFTKQANEPA